MRWMLWGDSFIYNKIKLNKIEYQNNDSQNTKVQVLVVLM